MQLLNAPVKSGVAGSFLLFVRLQGRWVSSKDDGAGLISGDAGSGGITYTTGMVTVNLVSAPDPGTILIALYQAAMSQDERQDIAIGPPGAFPVPLTFPDQNLSRGSLLLAYYNDGYQYQMRDDGAGNLVRDTKRLATSPKTADWKTNIVVAQWSRAKVYGLYHYNGVFYMGIGRADISYPNTVSQSADGINFTSDVAGVINPDKNSLSLAVNPSNDTMVTGGINTDTLRYRTGLSGNWLIPATMPTNTNVLDICYAFNKFMIVAHNSDHIFSSSDGSNWTDEGAVLPFTPSGYAQIKLGVDGDGSPLVVLAGIAAMARTSNGSTWTGCIGALGQKVRGLSCNVNSRKWIAVGTFCTVIASDDGNIWASIRDKLPALWQSNNVHLTQIDNNGAGGWIISGGGTVAGGAFCQSVDDGETWGTIAGEFPNQYGAGVAYSANSGKWAFVLAEGWAGDSYVTINSGGTNNYTYNTAQTIKYLPAGNLGTVNYEAGTGEITSGYDVESTVVARYYLCEKGCRKVAIHTAGADPIEINTFKIRAKKLSDLSEMEIEEVGGVLVGDGTGTLNRTAGYADIEFSEPYATDTVEADYGYYMIGSPQPAAVHDGINTAALPVTGLVPAVQEGDTIIISDGVNQDSSVIMEVNKDQLIISTQLTHAYAAGSLVSNAIVAGDLQAQKGVDFTQSTWNSIWQDTQQGGPALGSYDFVNNPLGMINKGSCTDRWRMTITDVVAPDHYEVTVEGQLEGVLGIGIDVGPYAGGAYSPINPATGSAYFSLDNAGWSLGWQAGNTLRFNTLAAGAPLWIARVINAKSSDSINDEATMEIRGDVV
jgi:hypothetical protein